MGSCQVEANGTKMNSPTLTYFDAPGRAEPVRLAFALGGIRFNDVRLTQAEWATKKASSPNGQLPILEVEGVEYVESSAMRMYATVRSRLLPSDPIRCMETMQLLCVLDQLPEASKHIWGIQNTDEKAAVRNCSLLLS